MTLWSTCEVFSEADGGRPDDGCLRELSLNENITSKGEQNMARDYYIQGRNQRGVGPGDGA